MKATAGTHTAMWLNFATAILAAADGAGLVNLVPPQYAWIGSLLTVANGLAHGMTGNAPVIGGTPK